MTTAKRWCYSTGERGRNRVRAYEERPGGVILVEFYERDPGGEVKRKRVSLGHSDRTKAKQRADDIASAFGRNGRPPGDDITLSMLFENCYLREVTPGKSPGKQRHDRVCTKMFLRCFGRNRPARSLNRRDWDAFIKERRAGTLAPRGARRRGVGPRQIEYDLKFLLAVLNWATTAGNRQGEPLLVANPLRGLPLPREANPKRPVMTQAQYIALSEAAPEVDWRFALALVLVHETGHRIGAVRKLRWSDIDLGRLLGRWRAENDKIGFEHETPLTKTAVQALHQVPRGLGEAWVLPSPSDPEVPCSRHVMRDWWERAMERAKLAVGQRLGWHSLRRKFATELKDTPLKDLCALGGWKDHNTVLKCYQHADEATMREALAKRRAV